MNESCFFFPQFNIQVVEESLLAVAERLTECRKNTAPNSMQAASEAKAVNGRAEDEGIFDGFVGDIN